MNRLFGTDGVRGVANTELTPQLAFNLGKAGAYVLKRNQGRPTVLIGKDTRVSGDMLEDAISAGILAMGGNVIKVGVLPTPAIAYLVRHMKADAGIVISASHNSYEYNGIKFFNSEGFKLDDDIEDEIEDIILRNIDVNSHISGDKLGRSVKMEQNAAIEYINFLKKSTDVDFNGLKIVIDCANGASYQVAEKVFTELGAEVIVIANSPDGVNINDKCGSTHPQSLQERVLHEKANLGLAFDGDGDRLIGVDEKGRILDGDKMLFIFTKMLKEAGTLAGNKGTVTVMSNLGFHKAVEKIGCTVDITQVGDRYVLESMLKTKCVIGGEQSGHIIFLQYNTTGDGILSAIQLVKSLKQSGKKLSELGDQVETYPQILINARVKNENKKKYINDPEIAVRIKEIEEQMAGEGRVLIRPSGTEPLVRIMLEGKDSDSMGKMGQDLAALISEKMG